MCCISGKSVRYGKSGVLTHPQEEGRPDAAALAADRVQDTGEGVDDLMAQLQALGQS